MKLSEMVKFSKLVLALSMAFIMLCLVLDFVIIKMLVASPSGGAYKVHRILTETHPFEIPILGSSRALAHFVPSVINTNCFNYGLDGTGTDVICFFLEAELRKNKNTPIIINFDPWGFMSSIGDINNYKFAYHDVGVKKLIPAHQHSMQFLLPGVRFYGTFKSTFSTWLNQRLGITRLTDQGAQLLIIEHKQSELDKMASACSPWCVEDSATIKETFFRLLKCSKRKIYIVVGPTHISHQKQCQNIEKLNQMLTEFSRIPSVCVINTYNTADQYEWSDWYDLIHLKADAAKHFSKQIKQKMEL